MAKKIVRGITDVKTINNQDYDTNNVNDLLSDGQYNYIHRKKGKNEEYHNLTDNIKTISSDNTELLAVTNNNKTTNTATLHPKHDAQKEQVLESTRNTITIHHGTNGTAEKTTVDTNPQKVLEHENLLTINGISKVTTGNTTTIGLKTIDNYSGDLNELTETCLVNTTPNAVNSPGGRGILTVVRIGDTVSQKYQSLGNTVYTRVGEYFEGEWGWSPWTGSGARISTRYYPAVLAGVDYHYSAFKQVVTNGDDVFVTFTFDCKPEFTEGELTGELKQDLEKFVGANMTVSNGGVSLTNDGTTMKLIKSGTPEKGNQQGTFTFFDGKIQS